MPVRIDDWQYFGRALGIDQVGIIDSLGSVLVLLDCSEGGSYLSVRLDWTCHCSCSDMGESLPKFFGLNIKCGQY